LKVLEAAVACDIKMGFVIIPEPVILREEVVAPTKLPLLADTGKVIVPFKLS
jgi:hypothetical protein